MKMMKKFLTNVRDVVIDIADIITLDLPQDAGNWWWRRGHQLHVLRCGAAGLGQRHAPARCCESEWRRAHSTL